MNSGVAPTPETGLVESHPPAAPETTASINARMLVDSSSCDVSYLMCIHMLNRLFCFVFPAGVLRVI